MLSNKYSCGICALTEKRDPLRALATSDKKVPTELLLMLAVLARNNL